MNELRIAALLSAMADVLAGRRFARRTLLAHFKAATDAEALEFDRRAYVEWPAGTRESRRYGVIYDRLCRSLEVV